MAFQNAAIRDSLGHIHPTTLMTGNVTQTVLDAVDLLTGMGEGDTRETMRRRLLRLCVSVVAFGLGCALGAAGFVALRFWCLALPLATTLLVLLRLDLERLPRA